MDDDRHRAQLRYVGQLAFWLFKSIAYFLSYLPGITLLVHFRSAPAAILLVVALLGFGMAGIIFINILISAKRFLIGKVEATSCVTIQSKAGQKFFCSSMLNLMMSTSPFRPMIAGLSPLVSWYYRGMGAKMPSSVFISDRAKLSDHWFTEIGENVSIGGDSLILGHLGHGKEIILGKVVIEEGAVIGAKSIIFPDVHIGRHARVGAGAVVTRGTVIPDGESWAGVPARKVAAKAMRAGA